VFRVLLASRAKQFLKKTQKDAQNRVIEKIKELAVNPFPPDAKRVIGRKEKVFRVRVGKYRITYVVFYENNEILISDIDKRERIYQAGK
jgi:mRNA interferase RelE/StbE